MTHETTIGYALPDGDLIAMAVPKYPNEATKLLVEEALDTLHSSERTTTKRM